MKTNKGHKITNKIPCTHLHFSC